MKWQVPRVWEGDTAYILAGGPSLTQDAVNKIWQRRRDDKLAGKTSGFSRVITINDSWRMAPFADVNYFCDANWWMDQVGRNRRSVDQVFSFHDAIYRCFWVTGSAQFNSHPQVHALRFTGQMGLEKAPDALRHGNNSGYQTIGIAYHYGARRIVLLGYDMQAVNGKTHWHQEERPDDFRRVMRESMLPMFEHLREPLLDAGVEVINATPGSALTVWPHVPLEEILSGAPVQMEMRLTEVA
jgi:hypothetical protein